MFEYDENYNKPKQVPKGFDGFIDRKLPELSKSGKEVKEKYDEAKLREVIEDIEERCPQIKTDKSEIDCFLSYDENQIYFSPDYYHSSDINYEIEQVSGRLEDRANVLSMAIVLNSYEAGKSYEVDVKEIEKTAELEEEIEILTSELKIKKIHTDNLRRDVRSIKATDPDTQEKVDFLVQSEQGLREMENKIKKLQSKVKDVKSKNQKAPEQRKQKVDQFVGELEDFKYELKYLNSVLESKNDKKLLTRIKVVLGVDSKQKIREDSIEFLRKKISSIINSLEQMDKIAWAVAGIDVEEITEIKERADTQLIDSSVEKLEPVQVDDPITLLNELFEDSKRSLNTLNSKKSQSEKPSKKN
ncbi:MAG: hypothetical protein AAGF07_02990 [Patescibacteria group bacterium]